jgi:hypothetical protein
MGFGHLHDLLVAADRGTAHTGVLASVIAIGGFVCLFAWVAWRFGPALMRFCGLASWWVGWACGSQGAYGYMVFFLIFGTAVWSVGTVWYYARRGYWPSRLSQRIFTRGSDAQTPDAERFSTRYRAR